MALSVDKILPLWIAPGSTKDIVITGTGFSNPATASIRLGGAADAEFTVNTTTVNSATQITANVTATSSAVDGTRDVRVTLTDNSFFQRDGLLAVSEAFTLKGTGNTCGFTTAEQTVLTRLASIANRMELVVSEVGIHYLAAGTTIARRQAFLTALIACLRKISLVAAYLTHTDRSSAAPALNSTGVGASPGARSVWVSTAATEWTTLGTNLDTLRAALVTLGSGTTGTAFDQIERAYDIRVDSAITIYDGTVFTGKTYATPYPDDITGGGNNSTVRVMPQLAAVHGDYRMAQWALYRSLHHLADAILHMNTIVGDDQVLALPADTFLNRILQIFTTTLDIMLAYAHVDGKAFGAPAGRLSMNPRFNTPTAGGDLLTNRGPINTTIFRFHEALAGGIGKWSVLGTTSLTARGNAVKSIKDAWLMNDQAAWASIFFNAALIPTSIAQAGDRQGEVIVVKGRYTFTRMDPPSFRAGTSMTVTIQGTGFENGMIPAFSLSVGSTGTQGVTVTSASVVSSTQITARITATADATPGLRDLTLSPPPQLPGAVSTTAVSVLAVGTEIALKGGFTAAEQAALQNLYDGYVHLAAAARTATAVLGAAGVSQTQMRNIFFQAGSINGDLFKGMCDLVHSEYGPNAPGFTQSNGFDGPTRTGSARSVWVDSARFFTDRIRGTNLSGSGGGVNHLGGLSTALTAAINSGTDAAVDAALTTARDTHLAAAITAFDAADMTLPFATPFPDDVVGSASPSVVHIGYQSFTVHGGHRHAMYGSARGLNYLFEQADFYNDLIQTGVFTAWTGIKAYITEIFTEGPRGFELLLTNAGANVTPILPPPGAGFANMNNRMAAVAQMWDIQTNIEDLSAHGFQGGADSLNAALGRHQDAMAQVLLQVGLPAQETNVSTMIGKGSDSWRNHLRGVSSGMRWNFTPPPAAPTTRALSALPSTAPAFLNCTTLDGCAAQNTAATQSGQAMAPIVIRTTGTTGATPTRPAISVTSGTLPAGIVLTDNGNGTATLSGTPTGGSSTVELTADNGTGPAATQSFTVTVAGATIAPTITSLDNVTFTVGRAGSFTVTVVPVTTIPTITKTGDLPTGVTFVDNADGTATLSGTPTDVNTFALLITAANGTAPDAVQNFTLTVQPVAKRGRGAQGKI